MLILTLRNLWPIVGVAVAMLAPLAMGWPLWVAALLLIPALWLSHFLLTWLAIAALQPQISQDAREMVPSLESLGMPSAPRSTGHSSAPTSQRARHHPAAVTDLARVIEGFGAEDLSAMVFARSHAAPAGYEAARSAILSRVVDEIRSSGRFEDHLAESHAAVATVRVAVDRAIGRISDLRPSAEFEAEMLEHASDLARYIILKPRLSATEYEALWGPYRAVVPELAAAADSHA